MILVKPGDLVISGINVEKGAVGVYQGDEDILATIHYSSYKFDKNKIDIDYFKWFLKSDAFRKAVQSQVRGGIKTELKPKKFLPLEIDLPDLSTQKQILKKINSMKNEISELESTFNNDKTLLSSLRSAILQEAVQGKLVPQNPKDEPASELLKKIKKEKEKLIKEGKIKKGKELPAIEEDEIPYELPEGWVWCRWDDLTKWITYGFTRPMPHLEKGIPIITAKNIINNKIEFSTADLTSEEAFVELNPKDIPKEGDILLSKDGSIGRSAIVTKENPKFCISQSVAVLWMNKLSVNQKYLSLVIQSPLVQSKILEKSQGVAVPHISVTHFAKMIVPLPPLAEQKKIVEKVDSLIGLCDELDLRVKKNKESSESLMGAVLREVFENNKT